VTAIATSTASSTEDVVTFRVGDQWFGVDVLLVQEVIGQQRIARVPLAAPEVAGFLNLRGQIVTAIDMHRRLEISRVPSESLMNVVVRDGDELFALIVDEVGDVAAAPHGTVEPPPPNLAWGCSKICTGIVKLDHGLLAIVDVSRLLDEVNTRQ
jgi:purine-binding chemotaxis protein CheW